MRTCPGKIHYLQLAFLDLHLCFPYIHRVFRRLGHLLLIVTLLAATGGHWAVLQTAAWANMIRENLQMESFEVALKKTFDGQHPCPLCKKIESGKKSEKKSEFQNEIKKLEFSCFKRTFVFSPPSDFWLTGEFAGLFFSLNRAPPLPPPKSLLG